MNEVYQAVTDQIMEALGKGEIPWRQSFTFPSPANLVSRKPYQGINALMTCLVTNVRKFNSPFWLTYKQAMDLGGTVKKGSKSTRVIFYKRLGITDEDGCPVIDQKGNEKVIPLLRYSNVFNYDQTEGIKNPEPLPELKGGLEEAARVVREAKLCPIEQGGMRAGWSPKADVIHMPDPARFTSQEHYYHVLFHEMAHATGHPSRLNRDQSGLGTDQELYAKEELVAEMTASFLSNRLGIMDKISIDEPAGYIQGWLKALKNDPKLVVQAAAQAEKAAGFILGEKLQIEANEPGQAPAQEPAQTQTTAPTKAPELPAWASRPPNQPMKQSSFKL